MTPAPRKHVVSLLGTGVTNGANVTAAIDTLGFDYADITVILGTANTTSNKPSVLTISESDDTTTNTSTFGCTGGTDFTIPVADTSNPNVYNFLLDCRYRKRYLTLSVTPRTTQEAFMHAELGGGAWASELPQGTTKSSAHLQFFG